MLNKKEWLNRLISEKLQTDINQRYADIVKQLSLILPILNTCIHPSLAKALTKINRQLDDGQNVYSLAMDLLKPTEWMQDASLETEM